MTVFQKLPQNRLLISKLSKIQKRISAKGEVEDTRVKAKDTKKNLRPRPRTNFPRTNPLVAKDRNNRGQGQGPWTQGNSVLPKKISKKIF